jgi:hypothetical protein
VFLIGPNPGRIAATVPGRTGGRTTGQLVKAGPKKVAHGRMDPKVKALSETKGAVPAAVVAAAVVVAPALGEAVIVDAIVAVRARTRRAGGTSGR